LQNYFSMGLESSTSEAVMHDTLEEFRKYREKMNEKILASGNQQIQRFFNLDTRAYEQGTLSSKTKELLGLVASIVLRCDDCVTYHVIRCLEEGVTSPEFYEAMNVALVVGGSITIPHLRRAVERLEECQNLANAKSRGSNAKVET
jgi:AhpD family alkylhydroperoxidase